MCSSMGAAFSVINSGFMENKSFPIIITIISFNIETDILSYVSVLLLMFMFMF